MGRAKDWWKWAKAMGIRYIAFRFFYELQLRSGLLKWRFPMNPAFRSWISLEEWRVSAPDFLIAPREEIKFEVSPSEKLKADAERIFNGEIQFFQGDWQKLPLDEWLLNVSSGKRYNNKLHWTAVADFDPAMGDIKYVWEKSRFLFLQTILRYDVAYTKDSSKWVFDQMESWIEHNPINQGPNYRCSQETSLRVFNWIYALYFYQNSPQLSAARFDRILFSIYWQLRHVRENIHFSRIAVRNNHAITETLALYVGGIVFPFFPESKEWRRKGKKWLEKEILFQFYQDGGYLQYSFNYQRVAVQLVTFGFAVAHRHNNEFHSDVYERAHKTVKLLATCQDPVTGQLPNYGANDGSLFFNWNDQPFRSFSPALDTLHYFITGKNLYTQSFEDRDWFGGFKNSTILLPKVVLEDGFFSFPMAGIYVFRKEKLLAMVVCASYENRPSQADNLHLDIWYEGKNLLRDGGSYRYNTDKNLVKYFFGTESHNTVMLGDVDQMEKGDRFIWLNWSSALQAGWKQTGDGKVEFNGAIQAFDKLGTVIHHRKLEIEYSKKQIKVTDWVEGKHSPEHTLRQLWHPETEQLKLKPVDANTTKKITKRYYSDTYGKMKEGIQVEFSTSEKMIATNIEYA